MLRDGTVRHSESSWSSVLHIVPKKDSGWRPSSNYRALNARTIPDRYSVRHIHDYSHQLFDSSVFSKIDLVRAYNQIPVHPADMQKTTITTPFGLFEFPFMSFGLRNAVQTFQRIFLFSHSLEDHEQHLRTLFNQLRQYGILINPAKCVFRSSEVTFLGYNVSAEGSRPLKNRVADLQDCDLLRPPVSSAAFWAC
jgi:hypothetical protein